MVLPVYTLPVIMHEFTKFPTVLGVVIVLLIKWILNCNSKFG